MKFARVVVLVAAMITPFPEITIAQPVDVGAAWATKRIVVYDHTTPEWNGILADTVADANAMLPDGAPEVVYQRMDVRPCSELRAPPRGIVVCTDEGEWPPFAKEFSGMVQYRASRGVMAPSAKIRLRPQPLAYAAFLRMLACHELIGHAILGIPDAHNSKTPSESCVHADAERPGSWDKAVAIAAYERLDRQKRHDDRQGRKRHRARHR